MISNSCNRVDGRRTAHARYFESSCARSSFKPTFPHPFLHARSYRSLQLNAGSASGRGQHGSGGGGKGKGPTGFDQHGPDDSRSNSGSVLMGFMTRSLAFMIGATSVAVAAWKAPSAMAASDRTAKGRGDITPVVPSVDRLDVEEDALGAPPPNVASATPSAFSDDILRLKRLQRELFAGMVQTKQRLDSLEAEKEAEEEDSFIPSEGSGVRPSYLHSIPLGIF